MAYHARLILVLRADMGPKSPWGRRRNRQAPAVRKVALEYQDGEDRKRLLVLLQYWMLGEASREEREEALQIGAGALEDLVVPTPWDRMEKAH